MHTEYCSLVEEAPALWTVACQPMNKANYPWGAGWLSQRPAYAGSLNGYRKCIPQHIWRKMKSGDTIICQLHKSVFSHAASKFDTSSSPGDVVEVILPFAYPEGVLIPMGEPERNEKIGRGHSLGIVPLNPLKSNIKWKYCCVNEDPLLQGYFCCIDNSGARYFQSGKQKYFRLGDYQTIKQIVVGIEACWGTGNCATLFSYCCQHAHELKKQKHARFNKKKKEDADKLGAAKMDGAVGEVTHFTRHLVNAYESVEPPGRQERESWKMWNVADPSADAHRNADLVAYCSDQRALALASTPNESRAAELRKWKNLHYLVIMVTSQKTKDEVLSKQYWELTQGRVSPKQMLAPLKSVTFFDYFSHLQRNLQTYAMHRKKAEAILSLYSVVVETYSGHMPESFHKMLAMKSVRDKIAAVTLNACGIYVSVGADSHVIKAIKYLVRKHLGKCTEAAVYDVASRIPEFPGKFANTYLAGIGQQIDRPWGDKEWVRVVIERVMNADCGNISIVRHWLSEYKFEFALYRVRLTFCSSRKQLAVADLLRICSIGEFKGVVNGIEIDSRHQPAMLPAVQRVGQKEFLVDLDLMTGTHFSVWRQIPCSPECIGVPEAVNVKFLRCGKLSPIRK